MAQVTTGSIEGWLVNDKNEPLGSAYVTVTSPEMLGVRGTTSNENGYFRLLVLPVGTYQLRIRLLSYSNEQLDNIKLALGTTYNVGKIVMKEKAIDMGEVLVTELRRTIDQSSTLIGANYQAGELAKLPLDRDYQSLSQMAPQANISSFGD